VRAALLALTPLLAVPAVASAGTVVSVRGASGPGPARYDRVSYERFGPASAKRVLILVPGTQGGEIGGKKFAPVSGDSVPFAREWGLSG
jgi:hypothetical protein